MLDAVPPRCRRAGRARSARTTLHATALAAACAAGLPQVAGAAEPPRAPALPAGFAITGRDLVWVSPEPLRFGGARYEIRERGLVLGHPIARGRELRLAWRGARAIEDPSVWLAGRRIDRADGAPASDGPHAPPLEPPDAPPLEPPDEPPLEQSGYDPATPGPFATTRLRYERAGLVVAGYPVPLEVVAEVTTPVATPPGALPLVLVLHGRHGTCFETGPDGNESADWPCPPGWQPTPSHEGYRYVADRLASQGFLVVSISANAVNSQDAFAADAGASARSQLVRHHLALWARWSASGGDPWGGRFFGRVDTGRVVLVGHSRGGEGVERAAVDSDAADAWRIRGLVLVAPTAYGQQVAPGAHTAVLLPQCDGDVSDLEGQLYVDLGRDVTADAALRSSIVAMGTNHNYFNTEWTPGFARAPATDDWAGPADDPQCGPERNRRLTPAEQQAVGRAYVAALVQLALADEARALPLLDGTAVKPASIDRAVVHVHAIGGAKSLLYAAGRGARGAPRELFAAECRGYVLAGPFNVGPGCARRLAFELQPHWIPMAFAETSPPPRALAVRWAAPGAGITLPVARSAAAGADAIDLRIAGEPGARPLALGVHVRDALGGTAELAVRPVALPAYAGPSPLGKVIARTVRAELRGAPVDPARLASIELLPRTDRGQLWLLDASAWRDRLPPAEPMSLPRVSAIERVVPEGDGGPVTIEVPLRIEGRVERPARVWVQLTDYADLEHPIRGFPLAIEPGATAASFAFTYEADDRYDPFEQRTVVALRALDEAVTGDYLGSVLVAEDEPPPRLSVESAAASAREGASLAWRFRLSAPMASAVYWPVELAPLEPGVAALGSDDLPAAFLEGFGITPPDPPVPLAELGLLLSIEIAAGGTEATLSIPIAADGTAEAAERIRLRLVAPDDPVVPDPIVLTGTVRAG